MSASRGKKMLDILAKQFQENGQANEQTMNVVSDEKTKNDSESLSVSGFSGISKKFNNSSVFFF